MSGQRPRPRPKGGEVRAGGHAPPRSHFGSSHLGHANAGETSTRTAAKGGPTGAGRDDSRPHARARAAADPNGKGGSRTDS